MQDRLGRSGRRRIAYALLVCLALASGCTKMTTSNLAAPKHTGAFALGGSTASVQGLIERLRDRAPAAMQAQGLTDAVFNADENRQWATVTFKNPAFYHWVLGIQFVRAPTESGTQANGWIRTFALQSGTISETELDKIVPKLRQALETAAQGS